MKQISFKLQIFEGPLDLLMHLINKNKVSIYDIPISEITSQYMEYLSEMECFDIEVSSEFLVMAANLLYIKSKMILPNYEEEEEEDPRLEIAERLIEYKRFKEASRFLSEREFAGSRFFYKIRDYIEPILIDESLKRITLVDLQVSMLQIYQNMQKRKPPSKGVFKGMVGREIVPVFTKVKHILLNLKNLGKIKFTDIFRGAKTRSEAVASFLAVLELMKMNRIKVGIGKNDLEISYVKKKGMKDDIGDKDD